MTQSRPKSSSSPRQEKKAEVAEVTPLAQLKFQNGIPGLWVTGSPIPPLFADVTVTSTETEIRHCAQAGIALFRLAGVSPGWTGHNQFEPEELAGRVRRLLTAAPDAHFLLELVVDAPAWWRKANPGECAVYCLPSDAEEDEGDIPCASWSSRKWLNEGGEAVTRLLRYVNRQDWASRCIALQISCGVEGEWRHPDANRLPDIGPRMTEYFRNYVLEKYRRNGGLLRKAWFDARADFTDIRCPDARDRRRTNLGILRNPMRSCYLLDYFEAFFAAQNAAAIHFCHMARLATGGKALIGLGYAAPFGNEGIAEDGHRFPEPILDAPEIDFLVTSTPTEGAHYLNAFTGSLALREKLLLHVPGTLQPTRLATALAATQSTGIVIPTTTSPTDIGPITRVMSRALKQAGHNRKSTAQVAVVVDPANNLYTSFPGSPVNWLNEALLSAQIKELSATGVSFTIHLLSDFFRPGFPEYQVTLFLNCFYLTEAERRQVDARVKRSEKTAVWFWAPGIISEEGIDAAHSEQLCGIKQRLEVAETNFRIRIAESNTPLTWGTHVGAHFGIEKPLSPTLTVTDRVAERLGANSGNKTNFAQKKFDTWNTVLFGFAPVPPLLLRNVLRAAGCHLYMEADGTVSTGGQSVAVVSEQSSTFKVSLPGRFDVGNAWTGEAVAAGVTEFTVKQAPGDVGLYTLRPQRERQP